jgi:Flp pilus assembly pilin Flp
VAIRISKVESGSSRIERGTRSAPGEPGGAAFPILKGGKPVKKLLFRLWREQLAQDLVEYVLIMTLIALVSVASLKKVSNGIKNVYSNYANGLQSAAGGGGGGNNNNNNNN